MPSCQRLTICIPLDCSPPGSSLHGILQARILEWITMPSSRASSWPRNLTCVSSVCYIGSRLFTTSTGSILMSSTLPDLISFIWRQGMVLVILSSRAGLLIFFDLSGIKESLKENLIPLLLFPCQVDLYYISRLRLTEKYLQHTHLPLYPLESFSLPLMFPHCFIVSVY